MKNDATFVRRRQNEEKNGTSANRMSEKNTSVWRRKNVEKGHLAPSNLTFLIIAIDRNGFRRMKGEGLIYKMLPQIF